LPREWITNREESVQDCSLGNRGSALGIKSRCQSQCGAVATRLRCRAILLLRRTTFNERVRRKAGANVAIGTRPSAAALLKSVGFTQVGTTVPRPHDMTRFVPDLSSVPQTMLLALHNRAGEANRSDGVLSDPDSVRIYEVIDYDCALRFGSSDGSLAVRAAEIDRVLREWLVLR
jgi:hypothetical protein